MGKNLNDVSFQLAMYVLQSEIYLIPKVKQLVDDILCLTKTKGE